MLRLYMARHGCLLISLWAFLFTQSLWGGICPPPGLFTDLEGIFPKVDEYGQIIRAQPKTFYELQSYLKRSPILGLLTPEEQKVLSIHISVWTKLIFGLTRTRLRQLLWAASGIPIVAIWFTLYRYIHVNRHHKKVSASLAALRSSIQRLPPLALVLPDLRGVEQELARSTYHLKAGSVDFLLWVMLFALLAYSGTPNVVMSYAFGATTDQIFGQTQWFEDFISTTLADSHPDTTLWVSSFMRSEQPRMGPYTVFNMGLLYKFWRSYIQLHPSAQDIGPQKFIKPITSPGDICTQINLWQGPPIETIILATHGSDLAGLEFHGAPRGIVQVSEMGLELLLSRQCSPDQRKLAPKVKIVFLACSLAARAEYASNSEVLASVFATRVAPSREVTVVMSRAILATRIYHEDYVNAVATFLGPEAVHKHYFDIQQNSKLKLKMPLQGYLLPLPVIYGIDGIRALRTLGLHSHPSEPQVYRYVKDVPSHD